MRGVGFALVVAGLAVVASATAARHPVRVSLTVLPAGIVTTGQTVKLTARAAVPARARLVIAAGRTEVAGCRRSPCIGSYRVTSPATVHFVASLRRSGGVLGTSKTFTVRWAAAPPVPTRAGSYEGRTTQNEAIGFTVSEDGMITRLQVGRLNEACVYPDGNRVSRIGGGIGPLTRSFPVAPDGSFEIELSGPTIVGSVASAYHVMISGRLRSGTAVGTIRDDVTAPSEPKLSCTTGDQSWVAVKG